MEMNKVNVASESHPAGDQEDGFIKDQVMSFVGQFNSYATRKTAGQGLLDFALLASNVSKLQKLLRRGKRDATYYALVVIIIISIILQLVVGGLMTWIGKMTLKTEEERKKANLLNNVITVMLTVISVVNILISAIDVSDT